MADCDVSLHSKTHVEHDGPCETHVGNGQEVGDGVGEDEGGGYVGPQDGGGADDERAGEVDQVKARQWYHQTENMNDQLKTVWWYLPMEGVDDLIIDAENDDESNVANHPETSHN